VVAYCAAGLAALGHLPTRERIVVERCFDDSEGSQLIIHGPFGGRINRALGLALRKRFCVSFDFELQAAADDDTVVLSLGPQHSFPLTRVQSMLTSAKAAEVLTQAVLPHPMLGARWRWNLNRALVLSRMNGGKRRPIHLQRMEADDLLAAVWPGLAACQENAPPGPVGVPDHVLARQTVYDCLHEGLSVEGLVDVWARVESGAIAVHTVESSEPSPFSHAILSGRPFTYLDDAPLEERRTRALSLRRGLGELGPDGLPVPASELAALDPEAVAVVLDQVRPRLRNADELHDLLLSLVAARPHREWAQWYDALAADGRADTLDGRWVATERHAGATSLSTDDEAAAACVGGHLQLAGPVTVAELTADAPLPSGAPRGAPVTPARARTALARLEAQGSAIELPDGRWCARHLLVRLHGASRQRRPASCLLRQYDMFHYHELPPLTGVRISGERRAFERKNPEAPPASDAIHREIGLVHGQNSFDGFAGGNNGPVWRRRSPWGDQRSETSTRGCSARFRKRPLHGDYAEGWGAARKTGAGGWVSPTVAAGVGRCFWSLCSRDAPMNAANNGWGSRGLDLNSGWNWQPRNQG